MYTVIQQVTPNDTLAKTIANTNNNEYVIRKIKLSGT